MPLNVSGVTKCKRADRLQKLTATLASCGLVSSFPGLSTAALFKTGSETTFSKEAQKPVTVLGGSPRFQPGQTEQVVLGGDTCSLEDVVPS